MKYIEFKVEDVLKVEQTKSVVSKLKLTEGNIPYVTRTTSNNGYAGTCGNKDKINDGNCITIGAETAVAFYQPADFVAGNKIYRLSREGLSKNEYLYLAAVLNQRTKWYSYSNARTPEKIKQESICLPVIESEDEKHIYTPDDINWQYMQDRIVELEQEHVSELEQNRDAELEAYFKATGLNDYELTEDDKHILASKLRNEDGKEPVKESEPLPEGRWWKEGREFYIADVFEIKNSKNILKSQVDFSKPEHPYLTAKEGNNSVAGYVSYDEDFLDEGNCVFIGGKTSTVTYQKDDFFSNDSHNLLLYPKEELSEETFLYLVSAVKNIMKQKYAWSNSVSYKKIQKDIFCLPIQTDDSGKPVIDTSKTYSPKGYIPDWEYMEKYIKATEKEIIKEVVLYKDKVIKKAKEIAGAA